MALAWAAVALGVVASPPLASAQRRDGGIAAWLAVYDRAVSENDLAKLSTLYAADATVVSEGVVAQGWARYRDDHLRPELEGLQGLRFSHVAVKPKVLEGGRSATVVAEIQVRARRAGAEIAINGVETLVLVRDEGTGWKIQNAHSSTLRAGP